MANIYLRSADGNDSDDGSTWALAKLTLQAAVTAAGNGGTVYMADGHNELAGASLTITGPTTAADTVRILSVDDTGNPQPPTALSAGGRVGTDTGARVLTLNGFFYFNGVTLEPNAAGTNNAANINISADRTVVCENCHLIVRSTSTASVLQLAGSTGVGPALYLINSDVTFSQAVQGIQNSGLIVWRGGRLLGTTLTSTVFRGIAGRAMVCQVEGVDFQSPGASATIFANTSANVSLGSAVNCKLVASVTLFQAPAFPSQEFVFVNCDSGDTQYFFSRGTYAGTETHEATVVRTGGSTDGTTPISRKIVTASTANAVYPYVSHEMAFWNDTLGAVTVTVPVLTDNVTLTDADAWIEVDYLGTSGFPLGLVISDRVASPIIGTAANQTTDAGSTWTTTGLGTPVKQSLSATFTPQEKGIVRVRVCVARASTTVYYDPLVLSGSGRQYQMSGAYLNEGAASGGGGLRRPVSSGGGLV